ncbi:NADH:ubiquinone reductase (Na(+)-transporting) subunit F [Simkania negevensis]|uniref:Na(+)-translocating NADH-quinone reductase subunit F n=1 Tax=Simkania negevensis TaxID=83561 RepID=A0ABS3AR49_9BACT|nr:NADH:ubiquinone reductase (Na(+)-transporting) subunit F [Simkania negevensis]
MPGVTDLIMSIVAIVAFVIIGVGLAGMILFTRAKLVSTAPVKLRINDDDLLTREVAAGNTLLGSLLEEHIPVPSPCGGKATCKQCKVQVLEGGGEPLETEKSTFSKKQIKEGWRLSCQCKVKEEMKLLIPHEYLGVQELIGTVVSNDNVATFIKELIVEVSEPIEYRSGAYMQFHVPPFKTDTSSWKQTMEEQYFKDWETFQMFDKEVDFTQLPPGTMRAYSMASYPAEGKKLMFNIRIASPPFLNKAPNPKIPWGICSAYTFALKPGDKVTLSGPYGESYMINDDRELIFLIGGAGSSFGRSHIKHLFDTEKTRRKLTMWYGARSLKENIYQEEYEELDRKHDNFSYNLVLSEPTEEDIEQGWPKDDPEKTAFLFKAFEKGQLGKLEDPEECLYYVCGPPLHNASVMKLLDDYGVPKENIILDDFGS